MSEYDFRNCQSLFGYAAKVHQRSGGVCQLCYAGAAGLDFDLWRQLTVEHLIGESQGGYLRQVKASLKVRFPDLSSAETIQLATGIDTANTVTACSFCNSTTSRDQSPVSMTELIRTAPDGPPDAVLKHVAAALEEILAGKKRDVRWKLASVRQAFEAHSAPALEEARLLAASTRASASTADVDLVVERITSDV